MGGATSLGLIGAVMLIQLVILPRPLWYLTPVLQFAPYVIWPVVSLVAASHVLRISRRWHTPEALATLNALKKDGHGMTSRLAERVLRRFPVEGYEAVPARMTEGKGSEIAGAR